MIEDHAAAPAGARDRHLNIAHALSPMANERGGDAAFLVAAGRRARGTALASVTFAELEHRVAACAGGLAARGVARGERVVVFVPMSLDLYVVLLAIFRLGAVAVFIDPWGSRSMIDSAARLVEPTMFVGVAKSHLLRVTSPALRAIPTAVVVGGRRSPVTRLPRTTSFDEIMGTGERNPARSTEPVSTDDPALVTFTTGSTGEPKGANRTHGFLLAQHETIGHHLDQRAGDVHLTNLPFFALHNLGCGVTTVLGPPGLAQDPHPDGAALRALTRSARATILALSPAPLEALANDRAATLPAVRQAYTGGGPVLPGMLERATAALPNASVTVLYGSTEAEPIAHCTAREVLDRRDAVRERGGIYVGTPVEEIDLLLVRPTDRPIEIPDGGSLADWQVEPGGAGEVVVAGAHVQREYFRNEQAFRENKIVDEHGTVWHRTGDMARQDPDGGLWLLGRRTGMFTTAGHALYPLEVETSLAELAEVARAAVCTQHHAEGGLGTIVAVEPAPGFGRDHARAAAALHLETRGLASLEVRTLERIPTDKRHGAKVDMGALRKRLALGD